MCGLAGFSGYRAVDEVKLRWLLVENEPRGRDSTGVYGNHVFKDVGKASELIMRDGFKAAIKNSKTVIGHTRLSTMGAVTKNNAHPFEYENCIGTHNGFIVPQMFDYSCNEFGLNKDSLPVDSMLIFAAISKFKDVNVISKIEGAMTLAFVMPEYPDTLYLYKRGETRSLFMAEFSEGIYYASEPGPLKLIGAKMVWAALPNHLYTIKEGKIVDLYRLKDPILKSLPASVKRSEWRQGTPSVEINALPINVSTHKPHYVFNKDDKKYETTDDSKLHNDGIDVTNYPSCGLPKIQKKEQKSIMEVYSRLDDPNTKTSNKDTLQNKLKMLIRSLTEEIEHMGLEPLSVFDTLSYPKPDLMSCMLDFHLLNKETKQGLAAYTIMVKGEPELATITSMNGFAVLHIPPAKCNTEMEFIFYDPVECFKPVSCKIKPESGRVMEVTLELPFLKDGNEEAGKAEADYQRNPTHSSAASSKSSESNVSGASGGTLYGGDEGQDNGTLSKPDPSLFGGSPFEETSKNLFEKWYPQGAVPKTDLILSKDLLYKTPKEAMEFTLPTADAPMRRDLLKYILEKKSHNDVTYSYTNWLVRGDQAAEVKRMNNYKEWNQIYFNRFEPGELKIGLLFEDAMRCLIWDRVNYKWYYQMPVYLEMLLVRDFDRYRGPKAKVSAIPYFPHTILGQGGLYFGERESKKKSKPNLQEVLESQYPANIGKKRSDPEKIDLITTMLKHGFAPSATLKKMTNKQLDIYVRSLESYEDIVRNQLDSTNEVIQTTEYNATAADLSMREQLIQNRNFLKTLLDDVSNSLSSAEYELSMRYEATADALGSSK